MSKMNQPKTQNSSAQNRKVNIAVVGLGFMGAVHLRAYQAIPQARIVAVCDAVRLPVNGVLAGVSGNVKSTGDIDLGKEVKVFTKLEDVLASSEVELVDLCTPTPLHPEQSIACLQAGKFVFCEKPLARTSAAGRQVLQAEAASPGFLMPAMCMRFWPGWSWLKPALQQQKYGRVLAARFGRLSEMPFWSKQGTYTGGNDLGGALFDLHIHDVDFIQFLFGKPDRVFATGVIGAGGSIDHVVAQYLYPGGPAVAAEGGWLMAKGFKMFYAIHCERATIDFDLSRGAGALQLTETGKDPVVIPPEEGDGYAYETRYIVDCVLNRTRPTVVTAADAVVDLQICEAEETSVRTGQVVPVERPSALNL